MSLKHFMTHEYSTMQVIISQILFLSAMSYVDSDVSSNVSFHVQKDELVQDKN
jgi:hypothetical protein